MANQVIKNTLLEKGVNTETRLYQINLDTAVGNLNLYHTLGITPVWAEVIQCSDTLAGNSSLTRIMAKINVSGDGFSNMTSTQVVVDCFSSGAPATITTYVLLRVGQTQSHVV